MRIALEQQHLFAIVAEQRMTIAAARITATAVPDLTVEYQYTPSNCLRLENVENLEPLKRWENILT